MNKLAWIAPIACLSGCANSTADAAAKACEEMLSRPMNEKAVTGGDWAASHSEASRCVEVTAGHLANGRDQAEVIASAAVDECSIAVEVALRRAAKEFHRPLSEDRSGFHQMALMAVLRVRANDCRNYGI